MSEYIGSRISLISKRDIRYVGTLHEINSETSTVALEQVKSYGTEGRSEEEVPPSDNIYEYIVFRGSDVKDLRIEKEPEKKPQPPQVPDDPAILGNSRPSGPPPGPSQPPSEAQAPQPYGQPPGRGQPPRFPQQSPYGYPNYPMPPNQRFGPYGGPQGYPPQGHPGMSYGPPPWYGPPGQGFPHGPQNQMMPPYMHQNFPGQPPQPPGGSSASATPAQEPSDSPKAAQQPPVIEKPAAAVKLPNAPESMPATATDGPPPPTESKPGVAAALAPPNQPTPGSTANARPAPVKQKSGLIQPAIPMKSPSAKHKTPANGVARSYAAATSSGPPPSAAAQSAVSESNGMNIPAPGISKDLANANRDARAAVAAAMAKLPPIAGQPRNTGPEDSAVDNLTKKVNEMRTQDNTRHTRGRAPRGFRGGRPRTTSQGKTIDVPKTDYDFESANAKFNKQDLVKEAIATGEPVASPVNSPQDEITNDSAESLPPAPVSGYNKTSSFFDNISSELKDREDISAKKLGGREFRSEEQKKNMETFGQGSVDSYRGGYRGRGRGRGRGRAGYGRVRGSYRGRGGIVAAES